MPGHRYWPLFDLRLQTADLLLRPLTEDDLFRLAEVMPADLELDPQATRYPGLAEPVGRGVVGYQRYWDGFGSWRPEHWRLAFAVFAGTELVGCQELEADNFPVVRTVDSSSYLVEAARGRGWGRQMRAAVLALAFGPLHARAAISSAWHDNHASLGVSRALGYRDNGLSLHPRDGHPDGADTMVHVRLLRADWLAGGHGDRVRIGGFEPCRPYFGLAEETRVTADPERE